MATEYLNLVIEHPKGGDQKIKPYNWTLSISYTEHIDKNKIRKMEGERK